MTPGFCKVFGFNLYIELQDPAEALRQHFQAYAAFGKDRHKDGSHITLSQIDRWFKQSEVVDGDNITTTDTGIVFKKISGYVRKKNHFSFKNPANNFCQ